MEAPIKWALSLKKIYNGENIECPECGSRNVTYDFYADENRVGFARFKCSDCGANAHLSRVRFPENVNVKKLANKTYLKSNYHRWVLTFCFRK